MRSGIVKPDEFIPERWGITKVDTEAEREYFFDSYAKEQDVVRNQMLAFSIGKRICIGQSLAYLEMKLVLATLFQRFDFEPISSPTPDNSQERNSGCFIGSQEYEPNCLTLRPHNAFYNIHNRKL